MPCSVNPDQTTSGSGCFYAISSGLSALIIRVKKYKVCFNML